MEKASELRQRAECYQRLKRQISDPIAVRAICDLADELETAVGLEQRHLIREGAHEIWIRQGRPEDVMWNPGLRPSGSCKAKRHASSAGVPELDAA
jgi:hypothetical protein